ncbi:hypothetical protein D4B38_13740 [Listeria monocytogenes]|nr:hypothetical protein [Listeria monocytogenes]EAH0098971.1 hypothetical protein [Listeria monocytogenes]EAH2406656.1 hypothetical protein [Listeria monocytogenes]
MTTSKRALSIFVLSILLLSILSFCFLYVQANSKVITQKEEIAKMSKDLQNKNEENNTLKERSLQNSDGQDQKNIQLFLDKFFGKIQNYTEKTYEKRFDGLENMANESILKEMKGAGSEAEKASPTIQFENKLTGLTAYQDREKPLHFFVKMELNYQTKTFENKSYFLVEVTLKKQKNSYYMMSYKALGSIQQTTEA